MKNWRIILLMGLGIMTTLSCEKKIELESNTSSFVKVFPNLIGSASDIIISGSGDILVVGYDLEPGLNLGFIKMDQKGNNVEVRKFDDKGDAFVDKYSCIQIPNGDLLVINRTSDENVLINLDSFTAITIDVSSLDLGYCSRPIVGEDGRYYLSGTSGYTYDRRRTIVCWSFPNIQPEMYRYEPDEGKKRPWSMNIVKATDKGLWFVSGVLQSTMVQNVHYFDRDTEKFTDSIQLTPIANSSIRDIPHGERGYGGPIATDSFIYSIATPESVTEFLQNWMFPRAAGFSLYRIGIDLDRNKRLDIPYSDPGYALAPVDFELGMNGDLLVLGEYTKGNEQGNFIYILDQDGKIKQKRYIEDPLTKLKCISATNDGGFVMAGLTSSGNGSDNSPDDVNNHWVVIKTDSDFNYVY